MDYAKSMTLSVDKVDERLINIYRIRKAHEMGIHLGFNRQVQRKERKVMTNFSGILKSDILIPSKSYMQKKKSSTNATNGGQKSFKLQKSINTIELQTLNTPRKLLFGKVFEEDSLKSETTPSER